MQDIREQDKKHPFEPIDVSGLGKIELMIQRGSYTDRPDTRDKPSSSPYEDTFYGPEILKDMFGDRSQYVGYVYSYLSFARLKE